MGYYTKEQIDQLLEETKQAAVEESLKALPGIIQTLIVSASKLQSVSTDFYKKNPDLEQHKPLVGQVIQELEGENPGISFEQLADKAGKTARERIGFSQGLTMEKPEKPSNEKLSEGMANLLDSFDTPDA